MAAAKIIIHKSRGEVSLVEQDTIDFVSTGYFEQKIIFVFIKEILCNFLVGMLQCLKQNLLPMKTKVAHNRNNFFFSTASKVII